MPSLFKKLVDQVNPFDGGKTWSNPAPMPKKQPAAVTPAPRQNSMSIQGGNQFRMPSATVRQPQNTSAMSMPKLTQPTLNRSSFANVSQPTFDTFANSKFLTPEQKIAKLRKVDQDNAPQKFNVAQAGVQSYNRAAGSIGAGLGRSVVGTAQGVSGIVDLATPGTGTSRVSQGLDRAAKSIDNTVKRNNLSPIAYKVGQAGGDILQFAAPGAIAKGAAKATQGTRAAKIGQLYNAGNNVVTRTAARVAARGTAPARIGARVIEGATPQSLLNIGAGTAFDLGTQASKGQDINLKNAGLSLGMNVGMGVGLPVAMQAAGEGARVGARQLRKAPAAAKNVSNAAKKANEVMFTPRKSLEDQYTLRDLSDHYAGAKELPPKVLSDTIGKAREIAARYGVDLANGAPNVQLERINSLLDTVGQRNQAMAQGGYVKNPFYKEGAPAEKTPQAGKPDPTAALKQEAKDIKIRTLKTADGKTEYVAQFGNKVTDRVGREIGFKATSTSPNFKSEGEMNKWIKQQSELPQSQPPAPKVEALQPTPAPVKVGKETPSSNSQLASNVLKNDDIVRSVMNGGVFKLKLDNGKVVAFGDPATIGRIGNGLGDDVTDVLPVTIGRGKSGNASTGQPRLILQDQNALVQLKRALGETDTPKTTVSERLRQKWGEPTARPTANPAPKVEAPQSTVAPKTSIENAINHYKQNPTGGFDIEGYIKENYPDQMHRLEQAKQELKAERLESRKSEAEFMKRAKADERKATELSNKLVDDLMSRPPAKPKQPPTPKVEAPTPTHRTWQELMDTTEKPLTDYKVGDKVTTDTMYGQVTGKITKVPNFSEDIRIKNNNFKIKLDEPLKLPNGRKSPDTITADGRHFSTDGKAMSVEPTTPQAPKVEAPQGAPIEKTPSAKKFLERDPMQQVFDQNPMSVDEVIKQRGRYAKEVANNDKINANFAANGAELPVYNTKKTSMLDKAFRSTRSIIERQGEKGKQLANMLQQQRDSKELWARDIERRLPTVKKLNDKEYANFVNATQGEELPLNPKVTKAITEWRSVHPEIRDRAIKAGLDVGNLGETYYPHFIDFDKVFKDKNTYNAAINHLVKTGQAPNAEEAIKLLGYARDVSRNRQFGNLEASRMIDIPFYDRTKASLGSYIQGSADRITKTEIFGKSDENALKLIADSAVDGADTEAMKNAYDIAVGAKKYNPTSQKISGGIRKYNTVTRLGLGALTNVSQNVNTGIVTGHMRTLRAITKQLSPEARRWADDTGVISDAVINDLKHGSGYETFGSTKLGKGINLITAPGFKQVETLNRRVAATSGRDYALRLAQKGDTATLRKLGVTGEIKGNTLTDAQQVQAARKVVEKTQFKVDPQDLPGWADSPGGKLVAQFRTFSYNQGKFFSNEILKPMAKGNYMPLARLMASLPLGFALYETRRAIDGRPEEENPTKIALQSFQKVGGAGLAFDIYQSLNPIGSKYLPSDRRQSMAASGIGGPTVGTSMQAIGAASDLIQRKNTPEDTSRLDGKVAIANTGNTYTDATPAARFALQQIPIVGTPIKNRLLPFKKESVADTGKLPFEGKASAAPLTEKQRNAQIKLAFGTKEGKAMLALKTDAEKQKQYPELFKQYKAMQKGLSDNSTGNNRPDNFDKLSDAAKGFYDQQARLTDEGKKAWLDKPTSGKTAKAYKNINAWKPSGYPDVPNTNKVAAMYAEFDSNAQKGKWTGTRLMQEKKKVLQNAYKSALDDNEAYAFKANDSDLYDMIQNGEISKETMDKLVALDNNLVKIGASAAISKKLRKILGYAAAPTKSGGYSGYTSKGSRKSSAANKKAVAATISGISDIYNINSSNQKKLRQLLGLTHMS